MGFFARGKTSPVGSFLSSLFHGRLNTVVSLRLSIEIKKITCALYCNYLHLRLNGWQRTEANASDTNSLRLRGVTYGPWRDELDGWVLPNIHLHFLCSHSYLRLESSSFLAFPLLVASWWWQEALMKYERLIGKQIEYKLPSYNWPAHTLEGCSTCSKTCPSELATPSERSRTYASREPGWLAFKL